MRIKRLSAYIIDMIIILFISNLLFGFLPGADKINDITKESTQVISDYLDAVKNNAKDLDDYIEDLNDCSYKLAKASVPSNIITVVLYFLYFIVFQMYNNGQTVGKRLLNLEVVSNDNEELSIKQMIFRGIILFPIITSLLDVLVITVFNQGIYENVSSYVMLLEMVLMFSCIIPILFNKTGLHEIISKTSVRVVGSDIKEESKVAKWKKTAEHEKSVKQYKVNHTSGKRKE